eukprot:gene8191-9035_t
MLKKLRMNDVVQAQHESSTTQDLISSDHSSISHFALTPYSVVGITVIAIAVLVLFSWIGEWFVQWKYGSASQNVEEEVSEETVPLVPRCKSDSFELPDEEKTDFNNLLNLNTDSNKNNSAV